MARRKYVHRAIPVALLLLLAGCGASVGGPTGTTTPGPTPTPTTPGPIASPTTPPDATAANTVAYGGLPAEARSAFDAARNGSARFAPDSPYVDGDAYDVSAADAFSDHSYVRRDGTLFAVSLEPDGYVASYQIRAASATTSQNAPVIPLANISDGVRDEVRSAVENGSHSVPPGKWSTKPAALEDAEFVRYEGETYHLSVLHGDHPTYELTVRPVA